jgi:hypothetical protein
MIDPLTLRHEEILSGYLTGRKEKSMKGTILILSLILTAAFSPSILASGSQAAEGGNVPKAIDCEGDEQSGHPLDDRLIVKNQQGVELGEIVNFVVDTELDRLVFALLDTGDSLAVEDMRLVPISALVIEGNEIILDMDEYKLANAPTPEPGEEPETFFRHLSEYYGVAPYWEE